MNVVEVRDSAIHGRGVFALQDIPPGAEVPVGSYFMFLNHSCDPNAELRPDNRYYARKPIRAGEEITFDYRGTPFAKFLRGVVCNCPLCRSKPISREGG